MVLRKSRYELLWALLFVLECGHDLRDDLAEGLIFVA